MEFYSLKHRQKVAVPDEEVRAGRTTRRTRNGEQHRYMLEAVATVDGVAGKVHKFVSKDVFDAFAARD